jgi:hypothetical protein
MKQVKWDSASNALLNDESFRKALLSKSAKLLNKEYAEQKKALQKDYDELQEKYNHLKEDYNNIDIIVNKANAEAGQMMKAAEDKASVIKKAEKAKVDYEHLMAENGRKIYFYDSLDTYDRLFLENHNYDLKNYIGANGVYITYKFDGRSHTLSFAEMLRNCILYGSSSILIRKEYKIRPELMQQFIKAINATPDFAIVDDYDLTKDYTLRLVKKCDLDKYNFSYFLTRVSPNELRRKLAEDKAKAKASK